MQQDPKTIIVGLLNIIEFEDDKEVYAEKFIQLCEKQALAEAITSLPEDTQDELTQKLLWAKDRERQKAILTAYIAHEQYKDALQKAVKTTFTELFNELIPTLSQEQRKKLQAYGLSIITQ